MYILLIKKSYLSLVILLILLTGIVYIGIQKMSVISTMNDMTFKVVIDPGHGSIDTGTSYQQIFEKDINLQVANYLKQELEKVNIKPIMTRTEDKLYRNSRRQDIAHRPKIAKSTKANLFVSIHANYFPSSQPSGSQIFYKPGSDSSKQLAELVQQELTRLRNANNRHLKNGDFYVLNQAQCPAILIEVGFLSNPIDRQKLTDPSYQKALGVSISKGIVNYFQSNFGGRKSEENSTMRSFVFEQDLNNIIYYLAIGNQSLSLSGENLSKPTNNTLQSTSKSSYKKELTLTTVKQLLKPPSGLRSPLPENTTINSIKVNGDKITIDFSRELQKNFNGGADLEAKTIEAISRTILSINGINEVEILIDGQKNMSIGGHIILQPVFKQK